MYWIHRSSPRSSARRAFLWCCSPPPNSGATGAPRSVPRRPRGTALCYLCSAVCRSSTTAKLLLRSKSRSSSIVRRHERDQDPLGRSPRRQRRCARLSSGERRNGSPGVWHSSPDWDTPGSTSSAGRSLTRQPSFGGSCSATIWVNAMRCGTVPSNGCASPPRTRIRPP
jgi:hypothetical protein